MVVVLVLVLVLVLVGRRHGGGRKNRWVPLWLGLSFVHDCVYWSGGYSGVGRMSSQVGN